MISHDSFTKHDLWYINRNNQYLLKTVHFRWSLLWSSHLNLWMSKSGFYWHMPAILCSDWLLQVTWQSVSCSQAVAVVSRDNMVLSAAGNWTFPGRPLVNSKSRDLTLCCDWLVGCYRWCDDGLTTFLLEEIFNSSLSLAISLLPRSGSQLISFLSQ